MISEIQRGDFTHVISDQNNDAWDYIQRATALENKKYSGLKVGPNEKYTISNVICYKGEPSQFFTMSSNYGEGILRCFTSQYTLSKFRGFDHNHATKNFPFVKEIVNFYDNVWPLVSHNFPEYKLFFYTTLYNESNLESLFKSCLDHPEKWKWPTDKLYQIGRIETKATAWKYVNYMGDISLLKRPYLSIEEYVERFSGQWPVQK